ncbi:reverse transcriptase domain-containing protein [Tanacetum coccineum]
MCPGRPGAAREGDPKLANKWSVGMGERETDIVLPPEREVNIPEHGSYFTDGSSCVGTGSAAMVILSPTRRNGTPRTHGVLIFTATNNEAEYEALLAGLRIAARMGVRNLEANVDSRLVANHVLGEYVAKEDNMVQYLDKTKSLIQGFDESPFGKFLGHGSGASDLSGKTIVLRGCPCGFMRMHLRTTSCGGEEDRAFTELTPITSPLGHSTSGYRHRWTVPLQLGARIEIPYRGHRLLSPNGLRQKRLTQSTGNQAGGVEELSHVLWAPFAQPLKVSTGDTPFSLLWDGRAVYAAEIGKCQIFVRGGKYTNQMDDERVIDLEHIGGKAATKRIREEKAKLKMKGYYDAKVRGVSFRPGDFVYRANDASHAEGEEEQGSWDQRGNKEPD